MVYPQISGSVAVPNGTPNGTLFVSVNKTYGKKIVEPLTNIPVSLEDCARGYWTVQNLSASRGPECEWLMATTNGCIVGVWRIDREKGWMNPTNTPKKTWPSDTPTTYPSRRGCVLIDVDEMTKQRFVGAQVHLGRCPNPLRGYFIDTKEKGLMP